MNETTSDLPTGKVLRLLSNVRRDGLWCVGNRTVSRWYWNLREKQMGVDTAGSIDSRDLGSSDDQFGYQPVDYATFRAAMKHLPSHDGPSAFIDYGCGKGRAVLLAAQMPFQKVLGVEISEDLCNAARENIENAQRHLQCKDVQIINADATRFVPPKDVSVVFMYNPFDAHIVQQVLDRLHESLLANPRPFSVVYVLPKCREDVLADCCWLEQRPIKTTNSTWERASVYRSRLSCDSAAVDAQLALVGESAL